MLNFINNWISKTVVYIGEKTVAFWDNVALLDISAWQIMLDIFVVAVVFYYILKILKGRRAGHIVTGLVILAIIYLISQILELFALKWLLDHLLTFMVVAIPIIFQQELRRGLEKLGQQTKVFRAKKQKELDKLINEIVIASSIIRKMQKGALIVFKGKDSLQEYIETGITLDAKISKELLISIFIQKSPLHDGAVIIQDEKLKAAACVLPHTFQKYSNYHGTRHKAALGLSEITDAGIIVISEEKATISWGLNEKLEVVDEEELAKLLKKYLTDNLKK